MVDVAVRVSVLGPCEVRLDGEVVELRPRERSVVAALVLGGRGRVDVDRLAALVWRNPPATARKSLQNHIVRIRQDLGVGVIETTDGAYRLASWVSTDVAGLSSVRTRALSVLGAAERVRRLEAILGSWRGEAYADLPSSDPVEATRAELHEVRAQIEEDLAAATLEMGDTQRGVAMLKRMVVDESFRERRWWLYMMALYRAGQRRDSLQAFSDAQAAMAERVGLDPGHALRVLESRILAEDPTLDEAPLGPARGSFPAAFLAPAEDQPGHRFVGRADERRRIDAAWSEVVAGCGLRMAIVEGDPGEGKTRLAQEVARTIHERGGTVAWGRCSPDAALPYEPVVEVLERVVSADRGLLDRLGPQAEALGAILPTVRHHADVLLVGAASAGDARSRLFRVVGAAFSDLAQAPLLWVVDDLQWATDDTLALLDQTLVALAGRPVLVLFTTRHAIGSIAGALSRWQRRLEAETINLAGLSVADLTELLFDPASPPGQAPYDRASPLGPAPLGPPPDDTAAALHARTAGNAFYVVSLLASGELDGDGTFDPAGVPATLRTWIGRRRDELPAGVGELLALGAVIGIEADIDAQLLADCSQVGRHEFVDNCERLLREGFLREHQLGKLSFPHALVRDAVYDSLSGIRRSSLHARVAEVLEARGGESPVLLAYHFARAGAAADASTYRYAMAAARLALDLGAWAGASSHAELARDRARQPGQVASALVVAAKAQRAQGLVAPARSLLEAAIDLAAGQSLGRPFAEGVLALVGSGGRGVAVDLPEAERVDLLRRALAGLDEADADLMVPVLSELAWALLLTDRSAERIELAERAIDVARRATGTSHLAGALHARRLVRSGPANLALRLADVDEILGLPDSARPSEATLYALLARHEDLLVVGDRPSARVALRDAARLADAYDHPFWSWMVKTWQALDAIIDGRLDAAEELAASALGLQPDYPQALECFGVNVADVRLYQGRAGEVVDLMEQAAQSNPQVPAYRAAFALCCWESGDVERAAAEYRPFADQHFAQIPDDTNRPLALGVLGSVAGRIGTPAERGILAGLLAPWADQHLLLNCYDGGGAYWGPVAHILALLSPPGTDRQRLFDRAEAAVRRFEAPLALRRITQDRTSELA